MINNLIQTYIALSPFTRGLLASMYMYHSPVYALFYIQKYVDIAIYVEIKLCKVCYP